MIAVLAVNTFSVAMNAGYGDARHTAIQHWSWTLGILELLLAEKYAYV